MNHSKLAMLDTTKAIFARGDELETMGLKVPQITKIMQALKAKGIDVPDGVLTVDEALGVLSPLLKKEGKLW